MLNFEVLQRQKKPFPHWVGDGFLAAETVRSINAEWPQEAWHKEDGKGQRKWSTQALPPTARAVVDAIDPAVVSQLVGIPGLVADPELGGGGLHCIPRGGFLLMHRDYNAHPSRRWHRRVNLLVYLNEVWQDDWRGHLQLGVDKPRRIAPLGGRCVVFTMREDSWHGHPEPLACPEDVQRRSLALYFYTPGPPPEPVHTTIYRR